MGVITSPDSNFAKEMVKHEALHSAWGPPQRPYVKREYPMMLHKAGRGAGGGPEIVDRQIADHEPQARALKTSGFRETPLEALDAMHAQDAEIATLAANRAFNEQGMTEKAKREAAAADSATGDHLPSVPETPLQAKSGRTTVLKVGG